MKTLKDPIKCTIIAGSSIKSLSVTRKSVGEQPMSESNYQEQFEKETGINKIEFTNEYYFEQLSKWLKTRLQEAEKQRDVHCSTCGKVVSGKGGIIRAYVECPECIEKQPDKDKVILELQAKNKDLEGQIEKLNKEFEAYRDAMTFDID